MKKELLISFIAISSYLLSYDSAVAVAHPHSHSNPQVTNQNIDKSIKYYEQRNEDTISIQVISMKSTSTQTISKQNIAAQESTLQDNLNNNANIKIPNIPEEFMYQGKPINALCIGNLTSHLDEKSINLKECVKEINKYKTDAANKALINKGYVGVDYSNKDEKENPWDRGYAYYKYLGKHGEDHVLYFLENTGGSGMFSNILIVKREGDKLILKENSAGGDRCNGGIDNAKLENNQLYYSMNLTPFDYIALSNENPKEIKPYDDLASCAVCCQGSANFSYDFQNKPKLISIDLGDLPDKEQTQGKYQTCFNQLLTNKINSGKKQLSEDELRNFVKEFNAQCVQ